MLQLEGGYDLIEGGFEETVRADVTSDCVQRDDGLAADADQGLERGVDDEAKRLDGGVHQELRSDWVSLDVSRLEYSGRIPEWIAVSLDRLRLRHLLLRAACEESGIFACVSSGMGEFAGWEDVPRRDVGWQVLLRADRRMREGPGLGHWSSERRGRRARMSDY